MPYLGYQQVTIDNATIRTVADFTTMPQQATHVDLQADGASVRYTMDGSDPAIGVGMLLLTTEPPQTFLRPDFDQIRALCTGASGHLNAHYYAGRDIP